MSTQKVTSHTFARALITFLTMIAGFLPAAAWANQLVDLSTPAAIVSGTEASFHGSYETSEAHDILVDVLDDSGWITGTRLSVTAGIGLRFWSESLAIPSATIDDSSAYVAVKLVPAGADWTQAIDEVIAPLSVELAYAEDYYPVTPLDFRGTMGAPIGNHGSFRIAVDDVIIEASSNYGPATTIWQLSQKSGLINVTNLSYGSGFSHEKLLPPSEGGDKAAYINALGSMIDQMRWIKRPYVDDEEIEYSKAIKAYLQGIGYIVSDVTEETIKLTNADNIVLAERDVVTFEVDYAVSEDRTIRIDIYDENWNYINYTDASAKFGTNKENVSLYVPELPEGLSNGWLSIKLLPYRGDWSEYIYQENYQIQYTQ